MSDKLNQSLDDILKDRRQSNRRSRGAGHRQANGTKAPAPAAPVGGVKKHTKTAKTTDKPAVTMGSFGSGDSKIIVSNLPRDVTETQIKDYFGKTIGPIKKVLLQYGPNGQSRGVATITFSKADGAAKAAKDLNGLKVDDRPMKIEVIVDAKQVPAPPPVKGLGDRIAQAKPAAKAQPKPATATKAATGRTAAARGRGGRKPRARGKPKKSAEELDADMQDYWDTGVNGGAAPEGGDTAMATNGGAAAQVAASGGDAGMEDEIM